MSPPLPTAGWPHAGGEMAGRIRAHDWGATPLGAPEGWGPELRAGVDLMLGSGFPSLLHIGPDGLLLYNDRAIPLLGLAHPGALGRRIREVWPEAEGGWEGVLRRSLTGETVARADLPHPLPGRAEGTRAARFAFSSSPLRGADGVVLGVLLVLAETAPPEPAETGFLLRLSDALRPLGSPRAVLSEACRALGAHLGADRVFYAEVTTQGDAIRIGEDFRSDRLASMAGRHRLDGMGRDVVAALQSVQPVAFSDTAREASLTPAERAVHAALGIAALVKVPLVKEGRLVAFLAVHQAQPRAWTAPEVALVGEVAERTWAAVERVHAESALRESEERFRQFGEASSDVLWIRDAATLRFEYVSPAFEDIYGLSRAELTAGNHVRRWIRPVHPEDRPIALDHLRRVRAGERLVSTYRVRRAPDGAPRWVRDTGFPLLDAEGRVQRVAGIGHDATESVEMNDRLGILVAELQHRTRNLLAVVDGLSRKTLAGSRSLTEFGARFGARLGALGRVNGLLARLEDGQRVAFDVLLRTELAAHGVAEGDGGDTLVRLEGPEGLLLRSSTVQTFALALHELTTNALKHGALARPGGRLEVRWDLVEGSGDKRRLRVDWRECVPDEVAGEDGGRRGYGRHLIEQALPYQLGAETNYELSREGVRCTITVPLSARMEGKTGDVETSDA